MNDKYGYVGLETLLNFCSNQKDHCVTPNDFMRMNRIKIWWCNQCEQGIEIKTNFCPNCGADMRKEGDEK